MKLLMLGSILICNLVGEILMYYSWNGTLSQHTLNGITELVQNVTATSFSQEKQDQLCNGEILMSVTERSKLYCYYSTQGENSFILQPIKIEILHRMNPWVLHFSDIFTETEASELKAIAEPMFEPATVVNITSESKNSQSMARVSEIAWLYPENEPIVAKIFNRAEMITGLSTDHENGHIEAMQMGRYKTFGLYKPHYDAIIEGKSEEHKKLVHDYDMEKGDRTATMMLYLSNVDQGGYTSFPHLGIFAKPVINSAVFWYNLKLNGGLDIYTLHSGCPVLQGEKWVSNLWFREKGQAFRRRCSLDPNE